MALATMHDLLAAELRDLYSAEMQMLVALPLLARGASHAVLREAFQYHLADTHEHVSRLEEVFGILDLTTRGANCDDVSALLTDAKSAIAVPAAPHIRDRALITTAHRIEQYEIVSYRTSLALATLLAHQDVATFLETTLKEEQAFDRLLSDISREMITDPVTSETVGAERASKWSLPGRRYFIAGAR